jgi:undecaprenyl diphosphate synthase
MLGLKALTLYAFSSENWKRPESRRYQRPDGPDEATSSAPTLAKPSHANDVRLSVIGDYRALR